MTTAPTRPADRESPGRPSAGGGQRRPRTAAPTRPPSRRPRGPSPQAALAVLPLRAARRSGPAPAALAHRALPHGRRARARDAAARWWPAAALALLVLVTADLLLGGPLVQRVDLAVHHALAVPRSPGAWRTALVLDHTGQRALVTPVLLLAALVVRRRTGRWSSAGLVVGVVVAMNLVIAAVKLSLARGQAVGGDPSLFLGGQAFPSGHAANAASAAALLVVLVGRARGRRVRRRTALVAVAVPSAVMTGTSLFLGFHWASDLLAGALVGVLLVRAGLAVEAAWLAARGRARTGARAEVRTGVPATGAAGAPAAPAGPRLASAAGPRGARTAQAGGARAAHPARAGAADALLRRRPGAPAA